MFVENNPMSEEQSEKTRNLLRAVGFATFLILIIWGPFATQVLNSQNALYRPWVMFGEVGVGLMDIDFMQVDDSGEPAKLDRFDILGYDGKEDAPEWLWLIDSDEDLDLVISALCQALGESADLRIEGRVANKGGWEDIDFSKENLCKDVANETS
jgi:hypothetical protein